MLYNFLSIVINVLILFYLFRVGNRALAVQQAPLMVVVNII